MLYNIWFYLYIQQFAGCSLVRPASEDAHTLSVWGPRHQLHVVIVFLSFAIPTPINNFELSKILVKQQTWIFPICRCHSTNMACLLVGTFFLIVNGLLCCGFSRRDITHTPLRYFLWRQLSCTRGFHYHGLFVCKGHHLQTPPSWLWYYIDLQFVSFSIVQPFNPSYLLTFL